MATSQAKARLFDLYPADAEALKRIRERLQLSSDALAVRLALRDLSRRLENPDTLADTPKMTEQTKGEPSV